MFRSAKNKRRRFLLTAMTRQSHTGCRSPSTLAALYALHHLRWAELLVSRAQFPERLQSISALVSRLPAGVHDTAMQAVLALLVWPRLSFWPRGVESRYRPPRTRQKKHTKRPLVLGR